MKHFLRILNAAVLIFVTQILVAQTGPVSLDRYGLKQRLYLLDESGRILISAAPQLDNPANSWVTVPSVFKAIDILATKLWEDHEHVFVTAYGLTQNDPRPRVIQYSRVGERECEWMLPEISAGIGIDTAQNTLYLSGSAKGVVYSLKLLKDACYGPKQLVSVLKINNVGRLGSLVVDARRRLAFVADVLKGSIYRIDLEKGVPTEIVRSLGQPVALLYDDSVARLYAVDLAGRRIWLMDVNGGIVLSLPSPIVFSRDAAFREPVSITFSSGGGLLVGDRIAKRLFLINSSGNVTGQFTVPN